MINDDGLLAGFDGSPAGFAAVRWSAEEARLRAVPLTICQPCAPVSEDLAQPPGPGQPAGHARDSLAEAIDLALRWAPGLTVRDFTQSGSATDVILRVADHFALLVVAAGDWGVPPHGIASLSAHVAARTHVPVIAVRGDGIWNGERIIVGIDDSAAAEAAARFAFEEAALRRVPLVAMMSCWVPPVPIPDDNDEGTLHQRHGHHRTYAQQMTRIAEERVRYVLGMWQSEFPGVPATPELVTGAPHKVLCEAACTAGLTVVGSRGLGPVRRTLLGSVSHFVMEHAPCPVAVVRPAS